MGDASTRPVLDRKLHSGGHRLCTRAAVPAAGSPPRCAGTHSRTFKATCVALDAVSEACEARDGRSRPMLELAFFRRPFLSVRVVPPGPLTPRLFYLSIFSRASCPQAGQGRQDHQEEPRGALARSRQGVCGGQGQGKAQWIRKEAWNARGAFADQGPVDASFARAEASSEEVQGVEED